jgi:hypothetical protein
MAFIDRNHVIQALAANRSNQSLTERVGLWSSNWSLENRDPQGSNRVIQVW